MSKIFTDEYEFAQYFQSRIESSHELVRYNEKIHLYIEFKHNPKQNYLRMRGEYSTCPYCGDKVRKVDVYNIFYYCDICQSFLENNGHELEERTKRRIVEEQTSIEEWW
jgi:hypothetical protein